MIRAGVYVATNEKETCETHGYHMVHKLHQYNRWCPDIRWNWLHSERFLVACLQLFRQPRRWHPDRDAHGWQKFRFLAGDID